MHWVLQDGFYSELGYLALIEAVERFELPHSIHKVVPFVGELVPEPDIPHTNVICFGSYSMRHAARKYGWTPGVFDLAGEDFEQQREHWGQHMLNVDAVVCAFKDATFGTADRLFVRPTEDTKSFAGQVFTRDEFLAWQEKMVGLDGISLTGDTLIQLAPPVQIYAEYRFWIVQGKVVTRSLYKRGDTVIYTADVDPRFEEFVEQRLAEWMPAETFVMDVCETADGLKIVETNSLNSSGFYAADVAKLVMVLEQAYTDSSGR